MPGRDGNLPGIFGGIELGAVMLEHVVAPGGRADNLPRQALGPGSEHSFFRPGRRIGTQSPVGSRYLDPMIQEEVHLTGTQQPLGAEQSALQHGRNHCDHERDENQGDRGPSGPITEGQRTDAGGGGDHGEGFQQEHQQVPEHSPIGVEA